MAGLKPSSTCAVPAGRLILSCSLPRTASWAKLNSAPSGLRRFFSPHQCQPATSRRRQPGRRRGREMPSTAITAARNLTDAWGWAAALLTAHTSPGSSRGILVSDQVRLTTVTPCRSAPAWRRKRKSGTRALRFVASACIPTGSPAEAQARFSEDPAKHSTGCRSEQHSQTLQAGQTELAEPFNYSNPTRGTSTFSPHRACSMRGAGRGSGLR